MTPSGIQGPDVARLEGARESWLCGSGTIDVSDPVVALNCLFSGGPPPEMGRYCLGGFFTRGAS